ncbi:MAG: 50S ribosomal protein L9 [Rhabdochlamydiaceae bacterium]|jgi:large subunit ribosomal protein L9
MRQQYLLIEDVQDIGRSGELITPKPGFARNYLMPQKKAVPASAHTLRMQAKLQEERSKKAALDKSEAEALAQKLEGKTLQIIVKVDQEGHLYGSVGAMEIVHLFEKEGIKLEKRNVGVHLHIKALGQHSLVLKLKEGVTCNYILEVVSDKPVTKK